MQMRRIAIYSITSIVMILALGIFLTLALAEKEGKDNFDYEGFKKSHSTYLDSLSSESHEGVSPEEAGLDTQEATCYIEKHEAKREEQVKRQSDELGSMESKQLDDSKEKHEEDLSTAQKDHYDAVVSSFTYKEGTSDSSSSSSSSSSGCGG